MQDVDQTIRQIDQNIGNYVKRRPFRVIGGIFGILMALAAFKSWRGDNELPEPEPRSIELAARHAERSSKECTPNTLIKENGQPVDYYRDLSWFSAPQLESWLKDNILVCIDPGIMGANKARPFGEGAIAAIYYPAEKVMALSDWTTAIYQAPELVEAIDKTPQGNSAIRIYKRMRDEKGDGSKIYTGLMDDYPAEQKLEKFPSLRKPPLKRLELN